jgi:hypothetical protein
VYFDGSEGFLAGFLVVTFRAETGEVAARRFSEILFGGF